MSSESELSGDSYVSSEPDRIQLTTKNLKEKRKRGTKIGGSSSDTSSPTENTVKKARACKDVTHANNRTNSYGTESSSEDGSTKQNAVSSSREPTEIKSVRDVSKDARTAVQRKCSDIVTDSFCGEVEGNSDRLTDSKSKNDSPDSMGDSNNLHTDSDSSVSVKILKKSNSPSTDSSGKECADRPKPVHNRKKKLSKEKLLRKQVQNDSSDDESSDSSRCSSEINKSGKKSKLQKQIREDSSAKGNADNKSLANKMEVNELKTKKQKCVKKENSKTGTSNKVKDVSRPEKLVHQNKEQEKIRSETDSELSESGGSKSSSKRSDTSDLKINKNGGKPKKRTVGSNRQVNKLSKKTLNKSSKATHEQNSCETSTDSDSGLEGSDSEMKCKMPEKVKADETLKSKVQHKESVSSSGSDSEPLLRKQNEKFPVGKTAPSDSDTGSDSESDKQRQNLKSSPRSRSSSSDDKQKTKNTHTVSSSNSDSEAESVATKKKEVEGTENLKNKPVKNVGEKNIGKSVEDPHRDKAVIRVKRYVKEAGLRIQNYASLWAGCRSNKARAQAIIGFLHENGLSGTPTLEKCKRLRIKREKKNEASELDLGNIINAGRESRRKAMLSPVKKSVEVHNPIKEDIKKRFARIQALGDSDSSSE